MVGKMTDFVHLHLHSEYSLLDGACRIDEIAKAAADAGQSAVAITDHGVMFGAVEFYRACKNHGVKPIIGCEVYLAARTRFDRDHRLDAHTNHLVLLVKNEEGYRNLCHMVSLSYTEGFYSKPRVDEELLRSYSRGLIALSGCLSGKIPRLILDGNIKGATECAVLYEEIFGKGNFYLELQDHGIPEQREVLRGIGRIAEDTGIPLVCTNDVHYINMEDSGTQALLMAAATGQTLDEQRKSGLHSDEFYFKTGEMMNSLFRGYSGAVENTCLIADKCSFDFNFNTSQLPRFVPETKESPTQMLKRLTEEGLSGRISSGEIVFSEGRGIEEYRARTEYELSIISSMGYDEYYLIVWDFVTYAKTHRIPTGPGRGSGAGSLVAFLIGITDIDSLKYNLLFERFLNPERISMPDFDIDFSDRKRELVIDYVAEKYGRDHVCQIITFGRLSARAALREVGRVLGLPVKAVSAAAKLVPRKPDIKLSDAAAIPGMKKLCAENPDIKKLLDLSMSVEGMPRHTSTHAAGVVITDKQTDSYLPLAVSCGTVVTQYEMDTVAGLGLLKFDFLGLRYLTVISDTEEQIREKNPDFDIESIDENDPDTYALISSGDTSGVFQLESAGMKRMLSEFRPSDIEDVMAAIALYRPGPMDSIPRYLAVRGGKDPEYIFEQLRPILADTCGCIVYQEQVMQICREIAGYTYGHADIVRRAVSKKKHEVMEKERGAFVEGATARGYNRALAEKLFDELASFASYAFNKSHAAAYAVTAYRTAWLKAHYRSEYMTALMISVQGDMDKLTEYMSDCEREGITILSPDIRLSNASFHSDNKGIRFGLSAIKNIGINLAEDIVLERNKKMFSSLGDFIARMAGRINAQQCSSLIKAGAFDSFEANRSSMLYAYPEMIERAQKKLSSGVEGQIGFFDSDDTTISDDVGFDKIPELTLIERLEQEKEITGFYFSGNPLDSYKTVFDEAGAESIISIKRNIEDETYGDGRSGIVIGVSITSVTVKKTSKGDYMAFARVKDYRSEQRVVFFPTLYQKVSQLIVAGMVCLMKVKLSVSDEDETVFEPFSFIAESVSPVSPGMAEEQRRLALSALGIVKEKKLPENVKTPPESTRQSSGSHASIPRLFIRVPDKVGTPYLKALNLILIFDPERLPGGGIPVYIYDSSDKSYTKLPGNGVMLSKVVLGELCLILGKENVVYKSGRS